MRELELLAELERRGLIVGVEHDAAEIEGLVITQDALVEGVHFRFDLLDWRELGYRAAAVNISDLAASGAEPLEAAAEALAAFGVAAEDAAAGADGPGTFHARLYDGLYALDPATLDERTHIEEL